MALTKITGQVINTTTDVTVGILTVTDTLAVGGTVSVGGTLTYEDVTNVDSVGLITARNGIVVGSGITLSKDGDIFATGVTTTGSLVSSGDVTANGGDMTISGANAILHLVDTNDNPNYRVQNIGGTFQIYDATTDTARVSIDSSGRFLIGTTTEGNESADELTINSSGNTGVTVRSGTSSNGSLYFSDATSGADEYAGFVQYQHASTNAMIFGTSSTEKLRIASDGSATFTTSGGDDAVLIKGDTYTTLKIQSARDSSDSKAFIQLHASRGSNASPTIIQNGDVVGTINARAYDGNSYASMSDINFEVDGAPGDGDMPGRIVFKTSADGAQSPTEAVRIDSSGRVLINTTNNANGHISSSNLAVEGADLAIFKDSGGDNAGVSGYKLKFVTQSGSIGEIDVLSEGGGGPSGRGGVMRFYTKANNTSSATERLRIDSNGHVLPAANDTYDLGSSSLRWRDIYTGDLNLSNKGKSNDVDGSWGDYTIQEGESDLFLINNRSGKKFKFNLTEVL